MAIKPSKDDSCISDKLPPRLNVAREKFASFAEGFQMVTADCLSKLSHSLKLPKLSSFLTGHLSKSPAFLCVELFVALALSVNFYLLVRPECLPQAGGNSIPVLTFSYLSEHASPNAKDTIREAWKKRLVAPVMSAWLTDAKFNGKGLIPVQGEFQNIFGLFHAGWLFLLFLILILFRKDSLLLMLGVFSGLMYNLTDPAGKLFYPWDMPAMFFFTLAWLLYDRGRLWPLIAAIWLGSLIKETVLCCTLLLLLDQRKTWRMRIISFVSTIAAVFISNKLLLAHYGIMAHTFAMNNATNTSDLLVKTLNEQLPGNLVHLFSTELRHVLFSNAGTLLIVLLIPWRDYRTVVFKLLMVSFVIGQFLFGVVVEVRIWYEILPLGWMLVSETFLGGALKDQKEIKPDSRYERILKGSYLLMITALLVLALGFRYLGADVHGGEVVRSNMKPAEVPVSPDNSFNKGSIDDAITQYEYAVHWKPENATAHNNLGIALYAKGRIEEAVSQFQEAIRLDPNHAGARNSLGNAFYNKGQIDEAISQFQQAVRLKPDDAQARFNLGVALNGKDHTDEAINQLSEALRLNPDFAPAHNNLGKAFLKKGKIDEAVAQFQTAIRLKPDYSAARENLVQALEAKTRPVEQ